MSDHTPDGKKRIETINNFALVEGLVHVCNSILLRLAYVDMNRDGESEWLNAIMVDLDNQPLSEDAKEMILSMISAVETTLRSLAEKHRH
jgi:hypothetical protein